MTKPLITTVTPSQGLPTGRLVVIVRGQYFNTQEPEPGPGLPVPTVAVTVGGEPADRVIQVARHRLDVVTPRYQGHPNTIPAVVDIVVTNLDENGDPVPGESTTAPAAFIYRRPDLTSESTVDAVNRAFLRLLRANIVNEVAPSTDPDWSRDPSSGATAVSQLPCILVDGPSVEPSTRYRYDVPQEELSQDGDEVALRDHPFTARFAWSIVLVADRKHEATRLMNAAVRLFHRRPFLRVPLAAESSELVDVDLWTENWDPDDRPQQNVYTYVTRVLVEPIYLDDDYGIASGGVPVDETTAQVTDADSVVELGIEGQ